ncbi:translation initiation factor IF-2-like [Camelus ferus]|uniref:Translation initiation factor IF-2-like n=1 Tax=Camelus ferus TaxID=419612 RepID=A0A8B8SYS3_CAMFR|nr:translation initiation factor IF-2-like [Camelus ferus]
MTGARPLASICYSYDSMLSFTGCHSFKCCLCVWVVFPRQVCASSECRARGVPPPRVPAPCLRLRGVAVPGRGLRVSAPGARWRRRMRARGGGGGGRGAARGPPGGGRGPAGGRAALRGPAAAGSNGEAGAAPANYISGTSIIRGKTRKRWRPAPGGPLPERPGPSLLLRPPSSPRRPRPAPPPPRPRPRPHGRTLGRAAAGRAQPPPPPMRLVARLQVGPADTQPRGAQHRGAQGSGNSHRMNERSR